MTSLVEQNFTLVLRIANSMLEGVADPEGSAIALCAQADQVSAELREAQRRFDDSPDDDSLRRVTEARATFCGQVAGERLLESFSGRGESGLDEALDTFDPTANAIVRYLNERADGDEDGMVAAVEHACAMLPPDRRASLSR